MAARRLASPRPTPACRPHDQATPASDFKRTPARGDAYVYIGWPHDGARWCIDPHQDLVRHAQFRRGARRAYKPNTGHHHLLIDTPLPPLDQPIPNDRNHLHFGLGQTETVIDLPPGTHTLQLLMGDADHVPHDPPVMSKRITIHVASAERR